MNEVNKKEDNVATAKKTKTGFRYKIIIFVIAFSLLFVCFFIAIISSFFSLDIIKIGNKNKDNDVSYGSRATDLNITSGTPATFDNSFTKEQFISAAESFTSLGTEDMGYGLSKKEGYQKYFLNHASEFYDIAVSNNLDPRFLFSIGILESGYGSSELAVKKNNLFSIGHTGPGAFDLAASYDTVMDGARYIADWLNVCYIQGLENEYNCSWIHKKIISLGQDPNTVEGIGYVYCDETWGPKVVNVMKSIFKAIPPKTITNSDNGPSAEEVQGKEVKKEVVDDGKTFVFSELNDSATLTGYIVYEPKNSKSNMPLIVWLHGSGEVGYSSSNARRVFRVAEKWSTYGLKPIDAYILVPVLRSGHWKNAANDVAKIIDNVVSKYRINENKISLGGHSLGGSGVFEVSSQYQDYFSCLVPMSSYTTNRESIYTENISYYQSIPLKYYGEFQNSVVNDLGKESNVLGASHGMVPETAFKIDKDNNQESDLINWMISQSK